MKIDDIIKTCLDIGDVYVTNWDNDQRGQLLFRAAELLREAYRTGFITDNGRIQRVPEHARFITMDGKVVEPFDAVYVAGKPCAFEISEDGTIADETIDHFGKEDAVFRYLRADECYSTKAAAKKAARRAGK